MDPTAPKPDSQNPISPQSPSTPPPTTQGQTPISSEIPEVPSPENAWSSIAQPASGGPQPALNPDGAGPILPGQFVITGQDTPPPSPAIPTTPQPAGVDNSSLLSSIQTEAQAVANPINHSLDNIDIQDQLITPPVVGPEPPPPGAAAPSSQPDPTPFAPPVNQAAPGGFSKPPGGGIKKIRSLIIILGIIVLLTIIGAIAWFFFFSSQTNQAASIESQNPSEPVVEQQPIPKRGEGGFEQIQDDSTPSGQLQQSTPAASAVPTP